MIIKTFQEAQEILLKMPCGEQRIFLTFPNYRQEEIILKITRITRRYFNVIEGDIIYHWTLGVVANKIQGCHYYGD